MTYSHVLKLHNIETRPYLDQDIQQVLGLMRRSLGESSRLPRTPEAWRWKHDSSPFGRSFIRVAEDKRTGNLVGLRAFMRWKFTGPGGRLLSAVRSVDAATDPDYQRKGIFKQLTCELLSDLEDAGIEFVFNTPNARSLAAELPMGWERVAAVRPLIKILKPFNLTRAIISSSISRPQKTYHRGAAPEHQCDLSNDSPQSSLSTAAPTAWSPRLHTYRTAEYYRWRYFSYTPLQYRLHQVGEPQAGTAIVFRNGVRNGAKELAISEITGSTSSLDDYCSAIRSLMRESAADYAVAFAPPRTTERSALRSLGFVPTPVKSINLAARILAPCTCNVTDYSQWALSLGDFELF